VADPAALSFLSRAARLDAQDELAGFREAFEIEPDGPIYLDGNSLGRMPKRARAILEQSADAWSGRLIRAWNEGWMEASERIAGKIARLIGAHEDEVALGESTSVCLFKLAHAALERQAPRKEIVTDRLNFPTDRYILQSVARMCGGSISDVPSRDGIATEPEDVESRLGQNAALLALTQVAYKSGALHDLPRLTTKAHEAGALALWDLSHSAGAIPLDVGAAGADLAVGCGYKYLNGGPGAPAFLFVRRGLQNELSQPIWGWLGHAEPFAFELDYRPAGGIRSFVAGTPPILSLLPLEAGVDLLLEAGMERLRAKSAALAELLIEMADALLEPHSIRVASPREPDRRGSHVSLAHPQALAVDLALIHEAGVIPDFRGPDNIRFGLAPLYNTFWEVAEAMLKLRQVLEERSFEKFVGREVAVT
jgi:kynureninase